MLKEDGVTEKKISDVLLWYGQGMGCTGQLVLCWSGSLV